ncbi:condensin-1 complex subunit CAP-D2 [Nymphaea colorata]|nr:condensin-1 complex subunit CAP-D2 [Nymphaea colorata]
MAPFFFPKTITDLEEEPEDRISLFVQHPVDVAVLSPSELEEIVKGVAFDLSDKELFCVEEQELFDQIYSFVKGFPHLLPPSKITLVESLRSNFSVLIPNISCLSRSPEEAGALSAPDRLASYLNAFKIYTYFLLSIVLIEELGSANQASRAPASSHQKGRKKHAAESWNWELQRGKIIGLVANSLEIDLKSLFGTSELDENYLSFLVSSAFTLFENSALLRDADVKDALCRIVGICATGYHYTMQSAASILHMIHKFDFLPTHMADLVGWAEHKYSDGSLAVALIREISRMNPKEYSRDTSGADNVGRFLTELADRLPKLVATNVGMLVPHFGGESYKIRNGLIGVLGKLIAKAFKDVDGDPTGVALRLRGKQAMLEIMLERCKDISAYTRSKVLQVWADLCEEHAVPIGLWNEVAEVAVGRLEDKSALVRKSALNLLITMLQHNPFGPQLRTASFEGTLEKYKKRLQELLPNGSPESSEVDDPAERCTQEADSQKVHGHGMVDLVDNKSDYNILDGLPDSCAPAVEVGISDDCLPDVGNLEQTRALVASLEAGLRFTKCISSIMPTLVQLLASSSASDVENAILLLMRCRQFQIEGAEESLRKMLPLVFSQDKAIYEAVISAFITIYVKKSPMETARNLLILATDSSIGDLAALECVISSLVSKGEIPSSTISSLWDFFNFNVSGVTAEQCRGALSILCMAAKSSPKILGVHLQEIIDIGFGRWAKEDPLLARTACVALQRLSEEDKAKIISGGGRVFGVLQNIINGFALPEHIWYAAADKAIAAIYSIHPRPEILAAEVVKKALNLTFPCNGTSNVTNAESGSGNDNTSISAVKVTKLSRFLFIVSHVALSQLVYIESCVKKVQKQKKKKETSSIEQQNDPNGHAEPSAAPNKENAINRELGLAASDEARLDSLSEQAEKDIISGRSTDKNLIGLCAPLVAKLCRNFNLMQQYPELQASGMLALCKLMLIDANFCEANLQLLFTVAENAPLEAVRSNCTIALGDLSVRFPNLLEPWTENMYGRLRDPAVSVRKNAVLVLSHLILNDMMKVKGYINEMAVRLEDVDDRISNLAKLFFHELSKKGSNPVYNLLPDILGRLSNQNLAEETFCSIMQFLIGSIKKDKQMEGLVEKLCNRFCGTTDVKQWEGIAYCLSLLTLTEKGIKKLIESFKSYEHALSEESVVSHFRVIINKAKKFAKPEVKTCVEEFEEKMSKHHTERKEQEMTAHNALLHQQKVESIEKLVAKKGTREDIHFDIATGEVINPDVVACTAGTPLNQHNLHDHETMKCSGSSGVVTASEEAGLEVQSPLSSHEGMSKAKLNAGTCHTEVREKCVASARHVSTTKTKKVNRRL